MNCLPATGSVLNVLDAELQGLVHCLCAGGTAVPPALVGTTIDRSVEWLHSRLSDEPWRSSRLWALRKPTRTDGAGERGLAIRLCHARPELFYEVPAASGVFDQDGRANKRANVDLAVEVAPGEHYILVELKLTANDPAFAAAEILRNFILYLLARRYGPQELIQRRPLLQARRIDLQVWAPGKYYAGLDHACLERNLAEGLERWTTEDEDQALIVGFAFQTLGEDAVVDPVLWTTESRQ